jgi:hypothetical protein
LSQAWRSGKILKKRFGQETANNSRENNEKLSAMGKDVKNINFNPKWKT